MPYVVKQDGATIAKDIGVRTSLRGNKVTVRRTSVYGAGEFLSDDDVSQVVKDKYDSGDEKVTSLIEEISEEDYKENPSAGSSVVAGFQAENGGPVDEPRKIQQSITRIDTEQSQEKANIVLTEDEGDSEDEGSGEPVVEVKPKAKKSKAKAKKTGK